MSILVLRNPLFEPVKPYFCNVSYNLPFREDSNVSNVYQMEIKPFISSSKCPDRLYIKRVRYDTFFLIQIVIFRMLCNNADAHV